MKTRRIPLIIKSCLALILVLISWGVIAKAAGTLDQQLIDAAKRGDLGLVKSLVDEGADLNARTTPYGFTVLIFAARVGNLELAKYLIDKGADVNAKDTYGGAPALMFAVEKDNLEMAKLLVGKGADVNAKNRIGQTALMEAALRGSLELVRYLVDKGADVNAKDSPEALLQTLRDANVDKGVDVNAKDSLAHTVLWYANIRKDPNSTEIIRYLQSRGAK